MLALLGALTVLVLLAAIMLNLLSPLVALIAVPVVAALLGGFGLATSKFIITGIAGIAPVAQAALLGQMTVGFPVSPLTPATFLIVGLAGIELGAHQRFAIPFLFGASLLMTVAAVAFGVLPL